MWPRSLRLVEFTVRSDTLTTPSSTGQTATGGTDLAGEKEREAPQDLSLFPFMITPRISVLVVLVPATSLISERPQLPS